MVVAGNSSAAISAASHFTKHFINRATPHDTEQGNTTAVDYLNRTINYSLIGRDMNWFLWRMS
jgi:hypothetical protein